jgi:Na+/H+ antiporter NhaC
LLGKPDTVIAIQSLDFNIIKVIPYIAVLVLALCGLNVFITLGIGTVLAGIIGLSTGSFGVIEFTTNIYNGYIGMADIFVASLWMGGLSAMVTHNGGINWMLEHIQNLIKTKRSAEVGIAALASVTDCATANNTVAIIVSGPIAKNLCAKYKVDPRKSASLLDIWSCVFQGLMPYAAQVILACSLTKGRISPVQIVPYSWYEIILAIFAAIAIFIPYSDKIVKKRPWDFDKWEATDIKQ